jgi:hypothetical protein
MIYYSAGGHMAVQIAPDRERKKAGREPTPEEAKAALTDYIAYFGTYTIDERAGTVTHHRAASIQPGDVAAVVRAYEFKGDRLILRPPNSKQEIAWERIKWAKDDLGPSRLAALAPQGDGTNGGIVNGRPDAAARRDRG